MDVINLLRDHGAFFATEGHKHTRPGWVNMPCPFCTGNAGMHLGMTEEGNAAYCWRCGQKPIGLALSKVLKLPEHKIHALIQVYGGMTHTARQPIKKQEFQLPSNIQPLKMAHKKYLETRGFDAKKIESQWRIKSTGVSSILKADKKTIHYNNRILIPIYWNGEIVSFQTRSIKPKDSLRYISCPKQVEIIPHQDIIYGNPAGWINRRGICVEGVTDVWRLGINSFCTFGIEFSPRQVRCIAKHFDHVAIIYDDETQAQAQACILAKELNLRGISTESITISDDPAALSQEDADYLTKALI